MEKSNLEKMQEFFESYITLLKLETGASKLWLMNYNKSKHEPNLALKGDHKHKDTLHYLNIRFY